MTTSRTVRFILNGRPAAITPAPGESLLDALRERCGITSIKDGCQPQGQCGCCLALVDGRPLVTCAFEAVRAEGAVIDRVISVVDRLEGAADAFASAGIPFTALLTTTDNPSGSINNSELELAGCIAHRDAAAHCFDVRERTLKASTDNLATNA